MTEWFIACDGKSEGPHTVADIVERLQGRRVPAVAMFWREGLAGWITLQQAWPELSTAETPTGTPTLPPVPGSTTSCQAPTSLADRIAALARVERLEDFSLRSLLSATFEKHGRDAIERYFSTGPPMAGLV